MIAVEWYKQTTRPRPWLTLGVMAAVPSLLTLVIGLTRPTIAERIGDWGSVITNTSGFTMPLIALSVMLLFLLPLAVSIFAGEAVAGEASWGSLRYLLARPISRTRLLASKAAVAAGFSVAAVVVVCAVSLLTGVLAFGWHPLTVLDLQHTTAFQVSTVTFTPNAALARTALAAVGVTLSLSSTFAFALLISTMTRSPFGAMAGGVGLGVVSRALDNIPGLHGLGPWLPVSDSGSTAWTSLFFPSVDVGSIVQLVVVQAVYTTVFLVVAWRRFARADVLA
ncbi:MAG TPA: ABC transporter permease [Streptosporangiaceae bacterium]|nr:ABC transporter permease [Streptosporangiaceae bacterium]